MHEVINHFHSLAIEVAFRARCNKGLIMRGKAGKQMNNIVPNQIQIRYIRSGKRPARIFPTGCLAVIARLFTLIYTLGFGIFTY